MSLGKALADPTRVRILYALLKSDLCVCEMIDCLELRQSTLSAQLQTIRQAGIVETTRRHKMISYALTAEARPLIEAIFTANARSMEADHRVSRDTKRIHERLDLREHGICVRGPGQLDQTEDAE